MFDPCNATFERLAREIGPFSCASVEPLAHLRSPSELANWTLPVVEALVVVGALLAFVHAGRRLRREGDPTTLSVALASIVYLLAIEPPLYFPEAFGLEAFLGHVFVHNVFVVQFMWERLPLYIVALYPALSTLAFEIVRSMGIMRRGIVVASICVGFVHHAFYEVFDQLGPQLQWWVWDVGAPTNTPWLAGVPMTSIFIFAMLGPASLALAVWLFVGRAVDRGDRVQGLSLAGRIVAAGLSVPLLITVGSLPFSALGGEAPNHSAQAVVLMGGVALFTAVAIPTLLRAWRSAGPTHGSWYPLAYGLPFLLTFAVLWLVALPDYLSAVSGVTPGGTPVGSVAYACACAVLASVTLVASRKKRKVDR